MQIRDLLHDVQTKLKVPKKNFNSFGKYNYRSCEDILEALKEVMPKGCSILLSDKIELIGDRYYVKATASFIFGDQIISVDAYAREPLEKKGADSSQITGATSSYARKYALNGLFCIDDNQDADSTNTHDHEPKPRVEKSAYKSNMIRADEKCISKLRDMLKHTDSDEGKFLLAYNIDKLEDIPYESYLDAMKKLDMKLAKVLGYKE